MNVFFLNPNISIQAKKLLKLYNFIETDKAIDADVLYCHFESKDEIKRFPNVRFILCPCTNINHLHGVCVYSPNGIYYPEIIYLDNPRFLYENVHSTAETTIWGMMRLLKSGLHEHMYSSYEIRGKTVGIIGTGRVGQQVATKLIGLGVKVMVYDVRYNLYNNNLKDYIVKDLDRLLYTSDIITVHTISNNSTEKLIGQNEFEKMVLKPWFINTSRGSVVDGKALLRAARLRQIKGFYIDVMDTYDSDISVELIKLTAAPNFIITKHKAGSTVESRNETDLYVVNKLLRIIEGK